MKKRTIAFFLALCMALILLPTAALAAEEGGGTQQADPASSGLPEIAFFTEQIRDAEHYLDPKDPQMLDLSKIGHGGNTIWLLKEGGFTEEEAEKISVQADKRYHPTIPSDTFDLSFEKVNHASNNSNYDLKVQLGDICPSNSSMSPSMLVRALQKDGSVTKMIARASFIETDTFSAGDYAVGFVHFPTSDAVAPISGTSLYTTSCYMDEPLSIPVRVLTETELGYRVVDGASIKIDNVRLEHHAGTEQMVSLTAGSWSGERSDYGVTDTLTVYLQKSESSQVNLWVNMTATVGGKEYSGTLLYSINITIEGQTSNERPEDDTVEQLNLYLEELAQNIVEGQRYDVYLAPTTYQGIIRIPADFGRKTWLTLHGHPSGTIVEGGMDLNESWVNIYDVSYRAGNGAASAIYNGTYDVSRCTFTGYDVAMSGHPCPREDNVFINNKVAVALDRSDGWLMEQKRNTFINNDTAIQVEKTRAGRDGGLLGMRITDCNFIGNKTDIYLKDCVGTFYEYRNYYGDILGNALNGEVGDFLNRLLDARTASKVNALIGYRAAKIKVDDRNQTKVVTNPRWLFPVTDWWQRDNVLIDSIFGSSARSTYSVGLMAAEDVEEEYTNILSADWEEPTAIFASEADSLVLDATAFEKEGEKQIDVLDDEEASLGTWSFGAPAEDSTEGGGTQ